VNGGKDVPELCGLVDVESALDAIAGCGGLSISEQCRILGIPRSSYYRWVKGREKASSVDEERKGIRELLDLADAVLDEWRKHPQWGYKKMARKLQSDGVGKASEKRVRNLYRKLGIRAVSPKFNTSRPPKGRHVRFPYLVKSAGRLFPNLVWTSDITYIRLPEKMVYLTTVMDLCSRKILTWRLSETMGTGFCLDALHEAIQKYGIPAIFNTDCGSQYLSDDFIAALEGYGIRISNDGVGSWSDNIWQERSWRTIKYECVFLHDFRNVDGLRDALSIFIHDYNEERPHQSLDYNTPDEVYRIGCFPEKEDGKSEEGVA